MARIVVGRGQKPDTERLAERLAFNDPDRTTPVHDDICLWLDAWLREAPNLIELAQGGDGGWSAWQINQSIAGVKACAAAGRKAVESERDRMAAINLAIPSDRHLRDLERAERRYREFMALTLPQWPERPLPDSSITWEEAIGDARWTSGFIDLTARVSSATSLTTGHEGGDAEASRYDYSPCELRWGNPELEWSVKTTEQVYAFEVKSTIPSLGELIRQVRYYESKFPATYYVVAPDTTHVQMLNSQNIGFLHYPSGDLSRPRPG